MAFPNPRTAHQGQDLLFAEARCFFLIQLPSRGRCHLANDSIISPCSQGCATRPSSPIAPSRPTRASQCQRPASQGSRLPTWRLGRPALRAGGHGSRCAAAGDLPPRNTSAEWLVWRPKNNIIQLLPVLLAGWELGAPERSLSTLEGRRGCGRGGETLGAPPRAARRGQSARLRQMRAAPASPAAAHPAARGRDGVSIPEPPGSRHVAMATGQEA